MMMTTKKFKTNSAQEAMVLTVDTEAQLTKEMDSIALTLKDTDNDWEKRADAMRRLQGLVRGGAHLAYPAAFAEQLFSKVKDPLSKQFWDLRSSLVKEAAQCVEFLMASLDPEVLDPIADTLVDALLRMLITSNKVLQGDGNRAMLATLRRTRLARGFQRICLQASTSKVPALRQLCVEYIGVVIQHAQRYTQTFFDKNFEEIEKVLRKTLSDGAPNVRAASRATFWTYYLTWEPRGTAFLKTIDDNVRKNLLKEDPRSSAKPAQTPPATATAQTAAVAPAVPMGTLQSSVGMPLGSLDSANTPASKRHVTSAHTPVSPSVGIIHCRMSHTITPGKAPVTPSAIAKQIDFMNATGTLNMDFSDDDDNDNENAKTISQRVTPMKTEPTMHQKEEEEEEKGSENIITVTATTEPEQPIGLSTPDKANSNPNFFTPKKNSQLDRLANNNNSSNNGTPYTSPRMKIERNVIPKILSGNNGTTGGFSQVATLTRLKKALEDLKSYDVTPHANLITLFLKESMAAPEDPLLILEVLDTILKKYPGNIVYSLDEVIPFIFTHKAEHAALCASIEGAIAAEFSQEILVPSTVRALSSVQSSGATAVVDFLGKLLDKYPAFFRDSSRLKSYIPAIASVALENASEETRSAAMNVLSTLFRTNRNEFTTAFLSLSQPEFEKLRDPLVGHIPDLGTEINKRSIEKNIYFITKQDANELAKDTPSHSDMGDSTPIKSTQSQQITLSPQTSSEMMVEQQEKSQARSSPVTTTSGRRSTNSSTNDSTNSGKGNQKAFAAKEVEEASAKDSRPLPLPAKRILYMLGKAASRKLKSCPEAFKELTAFLGSQKQQEMDKFCLDSIVETLCACAGVEQEARLMAAAMCGIKDIVSSQTIDKDKIKTVVLTCIKIKKKYGTTITGDGERAFAVTQEILVILEKKSPLDLLSALLELCNDRTAETWATEFSLERIGALCKVAGRDVLPGLREDFAKTVLAFICSSDLSLRKEAMLCLVHSCTSMEAVDENFVGYIKSKLSSVQEKILEHYISRKE